MADGQKRNIPLGGYGIGMSRGRSDIPLPYPPSGILRFCPSAMWSCFYTTDHIKSSEWTCYDRCSSLSGPVEYSPQYSMACIPLKMAHLWYQ